MILCCFLNRSGVEVDFNEAQVWQFNAKKSGPTFVSVQLAHGKRRNNEGEDFFEHLAIKAMQSFLLLVKMNALQKVLLY